MCNHLSDYLANAQKLSSRLLNRQGWVLATFKVQSNSPHKKYTDHKGNKPFSIDRIQC